MTEASLLSLVERYPHPTALARRASDGTVLITLRRLEARGLVRRPQGQYRLTHRGRDELALTYALVRLVRRSLGCT